MAFDVDVARNIGTGCSHCHTATVSPALSVLGENAAWWLPWVWKGSCRLQTGILLPPVTSLSSPLPSPGLGCAQISIRKVVSHGEKWLPGEPGGADRPERARQRLLLALQHVRNSRAEAGGMAEVEVWFSHRQTCTLDSGRDWPRVIWPSGTQAEFREVLGFGERGWGEPRDSLDYFHDR